MSASPSQDKFERTVNARVADGWRIESRTPSIAVLVKGRRPNHLLHLILTLLTFGFWLIVWVNIVAWGGERRSTIKVDQDERVIEEIQRPGPFKSWPPKKREI